MAKEKKKTNTDILKIIPADVKPPAAPEIEAAILGAMLIDKQAVEKATILLKPDAFYLSAHLKIYEAMIALSEAREPIDTITLYNELRKRGQLEEVGGAVYLSRLSQNISSAANIEYHAKIVLEKQILRELVSSSHEIAASAYQGQEDVFDILDAAEQKIFKITESHLKKSFQKMDKAVAGALQYIEAVHSKKDNNMSVKSGFVDLDDLLGGFQNSDLVIVAARPSMGKTAFALSLARNAAIDFDKAVAIFSLEMPTVQLVIRLLCAEGKINAHQVRTGKLPPEQGAKLSRNAHKLANAKIFIDDSPSQTILEVRAKARRLKAEQDIQLILIDYLQFLNTAHSMESREREISFISRSLKSLAKELNIPVIALSQMNRSVESRTDKRPQLSDLRESGSIEQDADVVMFLNRPEYYGITQDENGNSTEGIAEVIIAKQRNGPVGTVKLSFIKDYARFENLDRFHQVDSYSPAQIPEDVI
ncbi:MAG TPA: replicative DNA helicase [Ignavibacteriaceae bacterium]|nr:replicative DNA helicase [Ignavibacteriaceae bacterium]